MLTINRKKELILLIFEGGIDFNKAIFELTGEANNRTDRNKCREIISHYCNKNVSSKEKKHIVSLLEGNHINLLSDEIKGLAITGKWNPPIDGTSVF